jgi:hypothetical protein
MSEWRPIKSATAADGDIIVGWWDGEKVWSDVAGDMVFLDPSNVLWRQQISSYEDLPYRRGFRHRNGPHMATHWMPLPAAPSKEK